METDRKERQDLKQGMAALGLIPAPAALDQLIEFVRHLRKWNLSYNLVSASSLDRVVQKHLLDSLSIHSHLLPGSLLDVGTGAGFPGLPLAIALPGLDCTLLDSTGKKIRFLRHIKRSLRLANIHLRESRVSGFRNGAGFDNIVTRAFGSLHEFGSAVRHLAGRKTRLLVMKGKHPQEELKALPEWLKLLSVEKISVPDLHAERHLVIMSVS